MGVRGSVRGWLGRSGASFDLCFSLFCWENSLVSNTSSNTIGGMQLGGSTATTREPRSRLDEALDTIDDSPHRLDQHSRNRRT